MLIVVVSLVELAVEGLEFGIDFTGGILLEVGYTEDADVEGIRSDLFAAGFEDAQVQLFGRETDVLVRLPPQPQASNETVRTQLQQTLTAGGQPIPVEGELSDFAGSGRFRLRVQTEQADTNRIVSAFSTNDMASSENDSVCSLPCEST